MYLLLCIHLLIISVRLFKMLSSLCSPIDNFSFRDNMHCFVAVLYDWCIPRISHDISKFLFCSFSFQISLEWLPVGTSVMQEPVNWFVEQIDGLFPAWCDFHRKIFPNRLWYILLYILPIYILPIYDSLVF